MNIEAPIEAFEAQPTPKRTTVGVRVGGVLVGGTAPVVVQSMTNTDTADVDATVAQVAATAGRPVGTRRRRGRGGAGRRVGRRRAGRR